MAGTSMCWALHSTIWARRHRTTDPDPLRTIERSFLPSSLEISLTATRSAMPYFARRAGQSGVRAPRTLPVTARPAASLCPTRPRQSPPRAPTAPDKEKSPDTRLRVAAAAGIAAEPWPHRLARLAVRAVPTQQAPPPPSKCVANGWSHSPCRTHPVPGSLGRVETGERTRLTVSARASVRCRRRPRGARR